MGEAIKQEMKVPQAGYENLFNLDSRVKEMRDKDMEFIIHDVCAKDRDNQFRRKLLVIDLRDKKHDEQDNTSRKKAATYFQKLGVYLDGASVICSVGAAIGAQTIPGGLFHVAAEAFSKTSGYREKIASSEIEIYTHRYQRVGSTIGDQSQQIQQAEREQKEMAAMIDRLMQTTQRTFELMASSTG